MRVMRGLVVIPFLTLMMGCDDDDFENNKPDSPIDSSNNTANQIEASARLWLNQAHESQNKINAVAITPMVPSFAMVDVTLQKPDGSTFNKHLYAEKQAEENENGFDENFWTVGYLDENVMKVMAQKYGFADEVNHIAQQNQANPSEASYNPNYHDSWINNYILWHMMFNRPVTIVNTGSGYYGRSYGYRAYAPQTPLFRGGASMPGWASSYRATTGGRSSSITSGRGATVSRGGFGVSAGKFGGVSA